MNDFVPLGGQLVTLIFFLLPGFVFLWTFERMEGPLGVKGNDRILRAVAWSVTIDAMASIWIVRILRKLISHQPVSPWELWAGALVVVLVTPVAAALALSLLRRLGVTNRIRRRISLVAVLDATPTAWDRVFNRREAQFVRTRLKSGRLIGGFMGQDSFASSYPEAHDMYIDEAWKLDGAGRFVRPIVGSVGVLLKQEDIESLELLRSTILKGGA